MNHRLLPHNAHAFALDWIDAWNCRDLERILKHYSQDIEFSSPYVGRLISPNQNTVRGNAILRLYFTRALNAYPDLRFTLRSVYEGPESVIVEYQSVDSQVAAEMMEFNLAGLISRVCVHYLTVAPRTAQGGG